MKSGARCLFLVVLLAASGCYYDNEQDLYPFSSSANCDTSAVTYAATVLPIVQSKCYSCHNAGSASGNVILEGYSNLKTYAANGKLIGTITHASGYSPMPQGGNKLSDCDINKVQAWVNAGMLNN